MTSQVAYGSENLCQGIDVYVLGKLDVDDACKLGMDRSVCHGHSFPGE
jgi:hypothetical protein